MEERSVLVLSSHAICLGRHGGVIHSNALHRIKQSTVPLCLLGWAVFQMTLQRKAAFRQDPALRLVSDFKPVCPQCDFTISTLTQLSRSKSNVKPFTHLVKTQLT